MEILKREMELPVGERIKSIRERAGLTRNRLAVLAGIDGAALMRIERGDTQPSVATANRIGEVLEVDPADLLPLKRVQAAAEEPATYAADKEFGDERPTDLERLLRRMEEISKSVPDEEWEKLPRDFAHEHDHDIYGWPKRDKE